MDFLISFLSQLSVDSPVGVLILFWIAISINRLNQQVGRVIERVDSHEGRLGRIEEHLITKRGELK